MNSTELREILIGAAALFLLGGLFMLSTGGAMVASKAEVGFYSVNALFNRIDGLQPGDEVRMSGIPVGTVDTMVLGPDFRAKVTFRIDKAVSLPSDTAVAIHTDGLFGSKFVVLEPGGSETPLTSGARITYAQDSVIVADLLDLIIAQGRAKMQGDEKKPDTEIK